MQHSNVEAFIEAIAPQIKSLSREQLQAIAPVLRSSVTRNSEVKVVHTLNIRYQLSRQRLISDEAENFCRWIEQQDEIDWNTLLKAIIVEIAEKSSNFTTEHEH